MQLYYICVLYVFVVSYSCNYILTLQNLFISRLLIVISWTPYFSMANSDGSTLSMQGSFGWKGKPGVILSSQTLVPLLEDSFWTDRHAVFFVVSVVSC